MAQVLAVQPSSGICTQKCTNKNKILPFLYVCFDILVILDEESLTS